MAIWYSQAQKWNPAPALYNLYGLLFRVGIIASGQFTCIVTVITL